MAAPSGPLMKLCVLHAEMTIRHKPGRAVELLHAELPPEDRACLQRSVVFAQNAAWQELVDYATETPLWRVAVYRDGPNHLQLSVEPVHSHLKKSAEDVWRIVRAALQSLDPKLLRLDVVDEPTTQVITRASVGLLPQTRRREFWLPMLIAIANGALFIAGGTDLATLRGAAPGLLAAAVALAVMMVDANRKKLIWHD